MVTEPTEGEAMNDRERTSRYAEVAIEALELNVRRAHDRMVADEMAAKFMAAADAEQAELRAEVERYRDAFLRTNEALSVREEALVAEQSEVERLLADLAVEKDQHRRWADRCVAAERALADELVRAALAGPEPEVAADSPFRCPTFLPQDPNVPFVERERCHVDRPHQPHEHTKGLFAKYHVERIHDPNGKHADCRYFVLDPQHDPLAREALRAYADAAQGADLETLSCDLRGWLAALAGPEPEATIRPAAAVKCGNEVAHDPHWHVIRAGGITYAQGQCAGIGKNPSDG